MIVWAKSNGNWTDTTLWAFWNETTQQIEDYNQVPQNTDIVYCNGFTISTANGANIKVAKITNELNPYTNTGGGYINMQYYGCTITADEMYCETNYLFRALNNNGNIYLNGNCETSFSNQNSQLIYIETYTANCTITINGDIDVNLGRLGGAIHSFERCNSLIINGNITVHNGNAFNDGNIARSTLINGNLIINNGSFYAYHANNSSNIINGNIYYKQPIANPTGMACSNLTINGNLYYDTPDKNPFINIKKITFVSDNWEWKYTGEGDPEFIILPYPSQPNVFPQETDVKNGVPYGNGNFVGSYTPDYPPESVVLKDYEYGDSDDRKNGTMEQEVNVEVGCVTPEDVRKDVPLVGMGVVGSLVVPSVDDVRDGVVFDNGSVGTLIVQGGGDRLRIADFGYYTRSTSITYIVDLTESDKPAFADCEEIVLRSLFPTLDLDNIPDKFFDDLFVQFLRYRLLVEYYRGTSINSKFTPSEPTTEIVNYANTKCEYWLNTANLFLQLWGEKYPNSVKKDRILL